jgi:hypothetical protein
MVSFTPLLLYLQGKRIEGWVAHRAGLDDIGKM